MSIKKHILFIIENNSVPQDKRVWREALYAKKRGHDVSIISRKFDRASASFENLEGIDIYRHAMPLEAQGMLGYLGEYLIALISELFLSIKIYIKKPFHVIHAGNPPDTIFMVAMLFKLLGTKYVFDVHDLSPELYAARFSGKGGVPYKLLVLAEKLSCKLADVIITTNQSYTSIITKRHAVRPEKVFIVRNNPVIGEMLQRKSYSNGDGSNHKKAILYVGSINPQDGVDILLQALHYMVTAMQERNFTCTIIGDGGAFSSVKKMVRDLKLEAYVDLLGYVDDRRKIVEYLKMADVCVEPAPCWEINTHSTFIKIMEYMATGNAIVAFDLIETRFSTNGSAVLVSPGNIEEFARSIKSLADNPRLREQLGTAAQERIKNELNWESSLLNLKKAYEDLSL